MMKRRVTSEASLLSLMVYVRLMYWVSIFQSVDFFLRFIVAVKDFFHRKDVYTEIEIKRK